MTFRRYQRHTSPDVDLETVQTRIEDAENQLVKNCPPVDGSWLQEIELLKGVPNKISHKLERPHRGWFITRTYDSARNNMIALEASDALNLLRTPWARTDFNWDIQPVTGSSFDFTLAGAVITINDPGDYVANASITWDQTGIFVISPVFQYLELQKNGGAYGIVNTSYGWVMDRFNQLTTVNLSAGFTLTAADVPALFKSTAAPVFNLLDWDSAAYNTMTIQSVGNEVNIREVIDPTNSALQHLQLVANTDCKVDLWVF